MKPRTPIKRYTPPKKVNAKRKRSEWQRAYGSRARVRWIKAQPCVICDAGPCDNAHVESGGKGRKADYDKIVPLCCMPWFAANGPGYMRGHHGRLHQIGIRTFEQDYRVNLAALAADTEKRWQEYQEAAA